MTWQISNTFPGLLPKTYQLKIKNTLGCESTATAVTVNPFVNPTPKPIATAVQNFCIQQQATIGDISVSGSQMKWYATATGTINIPLTTPLTDGTTYFVTQTLASCESERTPVQINIFNTPAPSGPNAQTFCISQAAKVSDLAVTGNQIKWFSTLTASIAIPNNTLLQDGKIYYATQVQNSCESVGRHAVTVSLVVTNIPAADFVATAQCTDEDGFKKLDLTQYQSGLVSNSGSYTYLFYDQNNFLIGNPTNHTLTAGQNIFYVEIKSAAGCSAKVKLTIPLNAAPVVTVPASAEYCPNSFVKLDAGNQPAGSTFAWTLNGTLLSSLQTINADKNGTYAIKVTNIAGCSTAKSILVKEVEFPVITEIKIENSTVQIIAVGSGMLEYSIDGLVWQTSNIFYNVAVGNHTAYVRSGLQPCAVAEKDFTIFKINNVFTPDGDGVNDSWKIEGIENYPGSQIRVMDRFGTVVLEEKVKGLFSWNGQYLSRHLPTGNYWYYIIVSDGRILSGYVVIKNRN